MRITEVIIAGSVAGAVALATPALARHSDAQKPAENAAATSPCHSYEMGEAPKKSAAHSGAKESETH